MKSLAFIGKVIYAVVIIVFGAFHFMNAKQMAPMVPNFLPVPEVFVYLTGAALLAAGVAILINRKAQLAALLLGIMLVLFAVLIHLPGGQASMGQFLKDMAMAGAAFIICAHSND